MINVNKGNYDKVTLVKLYLSYWSNIQLQIKSKEMEEPKDRHKLHQLVSKKLRDKETDDVILCKTEEEVRDRRGVRREGKYMEIYNYKGSL